MIRCRSFVQTRFADRLIIHDFLVARNTEEAMILLVGDQLVGPGALVFDLLFVESLPPRYSALLVS
jgi:hypothetical protein